MERLELTRALEDQLRAQLMFAERCRDRAMVAEDPRLRSAWTGHFVRIGHAMAETGNAIASIRAAGTGATGLPAAALRLPTLPRLPDEGEGVPPRISKQLQAEF